MPVLKIWLDDERTPPNEHWVWVDSAERAIDLLRTLEVDEISLDHDLGDDDVLGTGYDVLKWIEEEVFTNLFYDPPAISIHTANASAAIKMRAARESIRRELQRRKES